ncbi:MAG: hypothetical protein JWQ60_1680 [Pseudonocardia sp.]|nr:hypothetical protein [Pseudonocardia sp.]
MTRSEEQATERPSPEDSDDNRDTDDSVESESESESESDSDDADDSDSGEDSGPALPPIEPVGLRVLVAEYEQAEGGDRLPWNWAALPDGHRETLVALVDDFVGSYNRLWAMTDEQTVPPCWYRHPALAYDLAALAWAYYEAYRHREATPGRALDFQAQLAAFGERLERWLGSQPGECRGGNHPRDWRHVRESVRDHAPGSVDHADAVALLGAENFGFGRPGR